MAYSRLAYSIIFYAMTLTLVLIARPSSVFDKETGGLKRFGVGGGAESQSGPESILPLGVVVVALAVACHFAFAMVDLVFV